MAFPRGGAKGGPKKGKDTYDEEGGLIPRRGSKISRNRMSRGDQSKTADADGKTEKALEKSRKGLRSR